VGAQKQTNPAAEIDLPRGPGPTTTTEARRSKYGHEKTSGKGAALGLFAAQDFAILSAWAWAYVVAHAEPLPQRCKILFEARPFQIEHFARLGRDACRCRLPYHLQVIYSKANVDDP
jgi:hypothetical protein